MFLFPIPALPLHAQPSDLPDASPHHWLYTSDGSAEEVSIIARPDLLSDPMTQRNWRQHSGLRSNFTRIIRSQQPTSIVTCPTFVQ
jgi:hypothetical protein